MGIGNISQINEVPKCTLNKFTCANAIGSAKMVKATFCQTAIGEHTFYTVKSIKVMYQLSMQIAFKLPK